MSKVTATSLLNRLLGRGKLRHLQVLLHLAELGSLQRTAQTIGMTQSAVTQTLAYVEKLLETQLFVRHARGVLPTAAGRALVPVLRQLLLGVEQGAEVLAAAQHQGRQTLRVVASASAIHGLLVPSMGDFVILHPDIRVELSEAEGGDLLLAAAREEADLLVCRQPRVAPAAWEFVELLVDQFAVVTAPGDPLLQRAGLQWRDLQSRRWLLSSIHTQARTRFEALCDAWDQPPDYFPVVTRVLPLAVRLIRTHGLLGFMPHSFLRPFLQDGVLNQLPVRADLSMAPIGLLKPAMGLTVSAEKFIDYLLARR